MSVLRLFAIGFIFCGTAAAWFLLGASVVHRTGESDAALAREVEQLWGGHHNQVAPDAFYDVPRIVVDEVETRGPDGQPRFNKVERTVFDRYPVELSSSKIGVDLQLAHRRKGLLWYDTYQVGFEGAYEIKNTDAAAHAISIHFSFPSSDAIYDGFVFQVGGRDVSAGSNVGAGVTESVDMAPGQEIPVRIAYRSRGLGDWSYSLATSVAQVKDFTLDMTTDFAAIDFPAGTMSPSTKTPTASGWRLGWRFDSLVTGQRIGMDLPNKLNPGPLASRITFFAPVSLLFFLTVMVILGVVRGQNLHPMNYFFVSAAFFAFHLLLAYLVDHLNVHAAFAIASVTSIFLVVSYLRLVTGLGRVLLQAALLQLVFLVLFGYAFFFEGYTGLTVTIGSILTLFVLMQVTGRVEWAAVFSRKARATVPQPA